MAESGKQNEPISGRRQGDASKCEMNRFGRVTPSAGRDVIDRRASFPSLLARAVVWLLELHVSRTILDQLRRRFSGMVQNACHSGDSSGPLDGSGVLQRLLPAAERRNFIAWRREPQGNPSCRPRRRPHGP